MFVCIIFSGNATVEDIYRKGLINFIRNLDKYTLQTEQLSTKAIKFRNAIINAKDPITLITRDIPKFIHGKELEKCDDTFIDSFKAAKGKYGDSYIIEEYPFVDNGIVHSDVMDILDKAGVGLPAYYSWSKRSGCYFCP